MTDEMTGKTITAYDIHNEAIAERSHRKRREPLQNLVGLYRSGACLFEPSADIVQAIRFSRPAYLRSIHQWRTGIVSSESDQYMAAAEFVTINGQSVRLTSLARDEAKGALSLVVIVRGSAARDELTTLMHDQPLTVSFPDDATVAGMMRVSGLELRSTGEGARALHRFAITLEPYSSPAHEAPEPVAESTAGSALMQRLDSIERKLDRLLTLLETSR